MKDDGEKVFFGDPEEDRKKEDEDQEDKVEKFFELIRNFREARKRLAIRRQTVETETISGDHDDQLFVSDDQKKKKKKIDKSNKKRKIMTDINWVTSSSYLFEKEDFTADVEFRGTPSIFPDPCNVTDKRRVQKDGLDLNLTL
ncbi:uncharacterized protein LOC112091224 isoform X2 [Morus notabilis]|uniref:uncharacterized protein LOC112091224 isoform X1 n=1 Tax=Morus notabilis TaxID=981085 RepID=UPI000CECE943|nr:uncharacterized protein LOC112091224 isoform X1 [Morus notabilis]XP_024020054.1 uncharacterized protein LOC112091224 isoform X2 [Morus notabilis]